MEVDEEMIDTTTEQNFEEITNINDIFTGKVQQIIQYEDQGEHKEKLSSDEFKFMYLNPNDKDLYSAWEASFETDVEGYKPDDDKVIENAVKQRWIVQLPKVLFFLITRVYYDKDRKTFAKNNDAFDFEEVIYPDRYLLKNREISDKLRDQVNKLRLKARACQDHINKFKNYNDKNQNIGSVLHSAANLLKSNQESMEMDNESSDDLKLFNPENLCSSVDQVESQESIQNMISYLTKLQEKSLEQVTIMEEQLSALQKEIKDHYKSVDATPYHLHSLMIHDGNHQSGHYYNFIKNFSNDTFWRYNDISVSEVSSDTVFEEAKGGKGTINAYCLVYISEDIYQTCKKPGLHDYQLQNENTSVTDQYNQLVPPEITKKVLEENANLLYSIMEAEAVEKASEIRKLYNERFDKIQKFKSDNSMKVDFVSQIVQFYIKSKKPGQIDFEHIAKFHLLNLWVKEIAKIDGGIFALSKSDLLREHIESQIIKSSECKNSPNSLDLSEEDQQMYIEKTESFKDTQRQALIATSVFADIIQDDYKSALLTIVFESQTNGLVKYLNVIKDAAKVISVCYWSDINKSIINKESYEQVIEPWIQALAYIFNNIINDDQDNHYKQALVNLKTTYEVVGSKMEGYQEKFSQWVEAFESRTIREFTFDETWTPKFKPELQQKIDSLNGIDYDKYYDCYTSENIGVIYNETFETFKTSRMHWIKIHRQIYKKARPLFNSEQFLEQEKEIGNDLKQFAAQ